MSVRSASKGSKGEGGEDESEGGRLGCVGVLQPIDEECLGSNQVNFEEFAHERVA